MKIAFITEFSEIGGGESNLYELTKKLSAACQVSVFCPRGKLFDLLSQSDVDVIDLKLVLHRHWYKFIPIIGVNRRLQKVINDFDLVHVYSVHTLPMVFGVKCPIVWTAHGYWEKPFGWRARVINYYVDKVICVSKDVYNIATFSKSVKELIHLGTSFGRHLTIAADKKFSASAVSLAVIGRFQRIKGQDLLLDALSELAKTRQTHFTVFILGDVNGYYKLDNLFKEEILAKVHGNTNELLDFRLEGFQKDVVSYILDSDFIVIPSRYESFSMVAVESLSLGRPIIAPDIGGPKDIVNSNDIGILFEPSSASSLSRSIAYMIDNYQTFDKHACIDRSKDFSIDIQAEKHLKLYHKLVQKRNLPKILFISARADCGGSLQHLMQLIIHLTDSFQITVACPKDRPYYDMFKLYADVVEIPHRKLSFFKLLSLAWRIKAKHIEVIHSHGKGAGVYSRLLGILTRRPVVHTFHGFHYKQLGLIKRMVHLSSEKFLSLFTSIFINVSSSEKKSCLDAGVFSYSKSIVIPNGVEIPCFKKREIDPAFIKLINVSRLSPEKGVDVLLDIASLLVARFTNFKLIIVGDGPERSVLENKAALLGLSSHVEFLGYREDIPSLLDSADIFISASKGEGLPISILEAMAHSLPVIASDVPGNCDLIINNNTGFLFDLCNPVEAADLVISLIKGNLNCQSASQKAYANICDNFTVKSMCDKTNNTYRHLLHI